MVVYGVKSTPQDVGYVVFNGDFFVQFCPPFMVAIFLFIFFLLSSCNDSNHNYRIGTSLLLLRSLYNL